MLSGARSRSRRVSRFIPATMLAGLLAAGIGGVSPASAADPAGGHLVSGGSASVRAAQLDIRSGFGTVVVAAAPIGTALYRVSTPPRSRVLPVVTRPGGTVTIGSRPSGRGGPSTIRIDLARGVRWTIGLNGGASTESVDMTGGSVTSVHLGGGVSALTLHLPKAIGTLPIQLEAGASTMVVTAPAGPPVQVQAVGGAAQLVVDGAAQTGVAGGTVVTEPGWAATEDRYEVLLSVGVSSFQLSRT